MRRWLSSSFGVLKTGGEYGEDDASSGGESKMGV